VQEILRDISAEIDSFVAAGRHIPSRLSGWTVAGLAGRLLYGFPRDFGFPAPGLYGASDCAGRPSHWRNSNAIPELEKFTCRINRYLSAEKAVGDLSCKNAIVEGRRYSYPRHKGRVKKTRIYLAI
jgi:hypothetical protein